MGAGKTTVGRLVAEQLGYRFFDTDIVIEQVAKKSVADIFAESGEAGFRELETQVLSELAAYRQLAIATGGGIILKQKNWSYLHHGIVVWLDVPIPLLYERLRHSTTRPLLQSPDDLLKTLQELLDQRHTLYEQADVRIVVQPGEAAAEVAARVLSETAQVLRPEVTPILPPN